jgi:hypothetical protein
MTSRQRLQGANDAFEIKRRAGLVGLIESAARPRRIQTAEADFRFPMKGIELPPLR